MPRASREQAALHRARIEHASARLLRERGVHGIRVAEAMAAAGLTHGGFYGHFASKDALSGAACARAFTESLQRWRHRVDKADGPAQARKAIILGYLDASGLNHVGTGCPTAALANDVAREPADKPVRSAYTEGVRKQLSLLESLQDADQANENQASASASAMVQLCLMVGAVALARATQGDPISTAFLDAARDHLLESSNKAGPQPASHGGTHP